ncbi:MAG TPA: sulfatase-like hydrolase/transferase [Chitinophaga sp.]|uniref:sulfatase-like hydrolase/transferase n=1 Tax=Chitinophaga sp. TaxID=1869181 RepID=UPI002DBCAF34|nr:sulfatase-like hydrolase/transferase [Chitinophaga sp.]HEU4555228.1 sulfatase-like hydrolase/transferase [Chitinophaga sp.]
MDICSPLNKYMLFAGVMMAMHTAAIAQSTVKKQPNIIFILTDDLGYGDLGAFYQQQRAKANDRSEPWMFTPHLDTLAEEGAMLPRQYCPAPVCAPSRASLMLGVSQGHANVRDNQFDKALENNHTLASTLRQAGYSTAIIGKWGLQGDDRWNAGGSQWPAHPLNRGFDYFFGYMRHVDGHEHYPKEGIYRQPKQVWENRTEISARLDKCYTADLWTAAAKRWITMHEKGAKAKQPFFLYLAFDTPHAVLELATQPYPAGGGLTGGLQWLNQPGHMINTASGKVDSYIYPDYANATYDDDNNPQTAEVPWPDVYKRYASAVRRIDDAVGDIVHLLKDLHLDDNTMIVFTSDNGPSVESYLPDSYAPNHPDFFNSFGPFDGIKRDCWEGGVRMPAIAWWPGHIPAHRTVTSANIAYDWMPTFTEMAGVPAPARTDGVSLLPSLTGKGQQRNSLVYVEYFQEGATPNFKEFAPQHRKRKRNQMQVIVTGDYVGVRYDIKSKDDDFEIYNVVKDPGETKNLAHLQPGVFVDSLQRQMKNRVLEVRRPDTAAARPYDNALMPAVRATQAHPGVVWQSYTGNFPWVPDVATLTPEDSGEAARPALPSAKKDKSGALYYTGYIQVPADGAYTFHLRAGDGALLRVHDAVIIDADFDYRPGTEKQGTVLLQKGLHPFRLYYKHTTGHKPLLTLQWEGPGLNLQEIPAWVFYHE